MKIFFTTFVIVFTLFMGGYYLYTYEKQTHVQDSNASTEEQDQLLDNIDSTGEQDHAQDSNVSTEEQDSVLDSVNSTVTTVPSVPPVAQSDDFDLTDDNSDFEDSRYLPNSKTAYAAARRLSEPRRYTVPEIVDARAADELYQRGYIFTHESFLDAIVADDIAGVSFFLKAGMKTEFACDYRFEIPADSEYFYYSEDGPLLYNPVSLAIVAGSNKVLPLLLESTSQMKLLNNLTCAHQKEPINKAYHDLFAFPVRSKNTNLLQMLLKTGLKPETQIYLAVALTGRTKKPIKEELTTEEQQRKFEALADIMIELINNGQSVDQSLHFHRALFPPMKPVHFVLLTGNKEFQENFIARINDSASRKKLAEFVGKIKKHTPPQAEAY